MGGSIRDFRNWAKLYDVFVETGTFRGVTTELASLHFKRVYTIELFRETFEKTRERLKHHLNIDFIYGDSAKELELLCPRINIPAIFYLDAHYAGDNTVRGEIEVPLYHEVTHIAKRYLPDLIIVDDYKNFGIKGVYGGDDTFSALEYDWRDISLDKFLGILRAHEREFDHTIADDRLFVLLQPKRLTLNDIIRLPAERSTSDAATTTYRGSS